MSKAPDAPGDTNNQLDDSLSQSVFAEIRRELESISTRVGFLISSREPSAKRASPLLPTPLAEDRNRRNLLAQLAEEIYKLRRKRDRGLPRSLVGEPAWDMLLAFYIEPDMSLTVGNACLAAAVPQTTGLRWAGNLERDGYLVRTAAADDRRRVFLRLTDKGRVLIEQCLGAMVQNAPVKVTRP